MSKIFNVPQSLKDESALSFDDYKKMYEESIKNPSKFWKEQSKRIYWFEDFKTVKDVSFNEENVHIKWFKEGKLNASFNCLDRHLRKNKNKTAIIWEGDDPKENKTYTYEQLHIEVCKFSNALKNIGVKKGDRVTIYLPMIPEAAIAMLSCSRIGAIHSVVFGGFSPESLKNRIEDCESNLIITANEGLRGGKKVPLLKNVKESIQGLNFSTNVVVVKRTESDNFFNDKTDFWYHELIKDQKSDCTPEHQSSEDPLFILYTSGSTGAPKGVLHTTAGYLLHASMSHEYIFDLKENDIYWCTADVGWVTGHSYIVYGPLCNGATTLMFEGVPTYPNGSRFWNIVDKHKVSIFYTAPTAIRSLMGLGDELVQKTSRKSLRVIGTVGEPINPEAWKWYFKVVGNEKCPIVDTYWQTETGATLISPMASITPTKPGSATLPFFGVQPVIVDNDGNVLSDRCEGNLCIKDGWPGMMRTVFKDHERFVKTYFKTFKGMYFTGDGCKRDQDGYYWITGRVDDVINVSGHRLGTAEVESALVLHNKVSEAAVVGFPHEIKGQGIYAYVTLMKGESYSPELKLELLTWIRKIIGPIATPDMIQWAPNLPKTRSGKIMRRILRKIACNQEDSIGDVSTLNEPKVVEELVRGRDI
ncbi:MAG: acetate--CoA ligase [Rickettsiales bacterium]|nr:acetate--CoA ligase [Rickettsiales bacterium]OUV54823.1 MAG: acetate--CoA ligase [Rickettsiales bacterium TMED127]|tara:strand:- start:11394 stop:13325 length:1932 start_codon:yes stop_codon:yes gene_type:complete